MNSLGHRPFADVSRAVSSLRDVDLSWGLYHAGRIGSIHMVELFLALGADDMSAGVRGATLGGAPWIVQLLESRGAVLGPLARVMLQQGRAAGRDLQSIAPVHTRSPRTPAAAAAASRRRTPVSLAIAREEHGDSDGGRDDGLGGHAEDASVLAPPARGKPKLSLKGSLESPATTSQPEALKPQRRRSKRSKRNLVEEEL